MNNKLKGGNFQISSLKREELFEELFEENEDKVYSTYRSSPLGLTKQEEKDVI